MKERATEKVTEFQILHFPCVIDSTYVFIYINMTMYSVKKIMLEMSKKSTLIRLAIILISTN